KLRPGDLVGAICGIDGVTAEDIGVIDIQEHHAFVEILHGKGGTVLQALQTRTIKNRKIKVEEARS
ncbi:MAG: DbpA RNA binding domain-containing protein, partial [Merdibacter sp.]